MKHKFISKRYWNNVPTPMGLSGSLAGKFDDIINLSLGDPDLNTHNKIIEKAFQDALNGHTHYTSPLGYEELREEILKHYKEDFSYEITLDECFVTTSGCHAMWLILESVLDDGDEVIIPEPYFTPYPDQVLLARGKPVFLKTSEDDEFRINIDKLEACITNRTKAIIINTPNNPTGVCFSKSTLKNIAKIAIKYDLLVIADDIYTAFSYAEPFIPITTLDGMKERTLSIRSFSKDYCMTGWRIGYVIGPAKILGIMKDINENNVFTAPSPSQRGAIAALKLRHEIQPPIIEEFKKRAYYAYERIQKISYLSCLKPSGSLYIFVNIKKTGLTSREFCDKLLEKYHILAIPGDAFGESGEGYIRIALTLGIDKLKEAFDRLNKNTEFEC